MCFGGKYQFDVLSIFKKLRLGDPKSITMRLLMADRYIKHPMGIIYDNLVKVEKFIFLVDFVILDCEVDIEVHIILCWPFLATERNHVDIESGEWKFRINDKEFTFNVCKSIKQ